MLNVRILLGHLVLLVIISSLFSACSKEKTSHKYLFLGHPYRYGDGFENRVDPRIEELDKSIFDQIWLGGDVCAKTNTDTNTLVYLDSIFDIKSPYTYWTYGNHDIMFAKNNLIENATHKKSYYANYNDGNTVLQINTNLDTMYVKYPQERLCDKKNEQYLLIKNVCDTISQKSRYLIFIMHHILWYEIDTSAHNYANFLPKLWNAKCDSSSNFFNSIYPLIKNVQQKGVQVICVGGDVGMYFKLGSYTDSRGIIYLASGINNSIIWDKEKRKEALKDRVLIFNNDLITKKLTWVFADLDSLLLSQKK